MAADGYTNLKKRETLSCRRCSPCEPFLNSSGILALCSTKQAQVGHWVSRLNILFATFLGKLYVYCGEQGNLCRYWEAGNISGHEIWPKQKAKKKKKIVVHLHICIKLKSTTPQMQTLHDAAYKRHCNSMHQILPCHSWLSHAVPDCLPRNPVIYFL